MRTWYFFAFLFIFPFFSGAQNLVINPGFESLGKLILRTYCYGSEEFSLATPGWTVPTRGTPDHYSKGYYYENQEAEEGDNFAGIIVYDYDTGRDYHEYIQARLGSPLEAGRQYHISFFISFNEDDDNSVAIDRLGVLFTARRLEIEHEKNMGRASVETADSIFFTDKKGWTEIDLTYTAMGGEKYMTIGNFHSLKETHIKRLRKKPHYGDRCYYFIDDVCVAAINKSGNYDCCCSLTGKEPEQVKAIKEDTIVWTELPPLEYRLAYAQGKNNTPPQSFPAPGKTIVFTSLLFETNKSELQPLSFPSLDSLADFLISKPEYTISISGHTDNSGDEVSNDSLSAHRAKAVADYLIGKGINADRVSSQGYGSKQPVADNETPEGRAKNRRVEYILEEKK